MATDEELVGFFHRHVIALVFTFQKERETRNLAVTAFVLSVSDQWFLITAGHCIRLVDSMTSELGYNLSRCQLVDSLGIGALHPEAIPFAYRDSHPTCISDDYAFDYGVMVLSPYYRRLLQANSVEALDEDVWKKQPTVVDFYMLLGIPSEFVTVDSQNISIGSTLHKVEPLDERPEGFTQVDTPLFYGRIRLREGMTSIQGMSGGPVFAFHLNEKGELRYWLTALQSRWLPDSHAIAACPTRLLGHFLEDVVLQVTQR